MATTISGGGGTDVVIPEGVSSDQVDVVVTDEGDTKVAVNKTTEDLVIAAKGSTSVSGERVVDAEINVSTSKSETANIVLETSSAKNATISNEGKGALEVEVNTGTVRNLTIDAGNKKRADLVSFKDAVKLTRATMDMGKGNDTVRFGKDVTFKGKTNIDLGKDGNDSIVIEADSIGKGKLKVTNFTKKDTITVGDETFTYKDIKNGAEVPGVQVELA